MSGNLYHRNQDALCIRRNLPLPADYENILLPIIDNLAGYGVSDPSHG